MPLTSRRRRPLDRSLEPERDARLVIIAAEGRATERQYFAMFHSTRVQVKALHTEEDDRSAPEYVLERLRRFHAEYELGEGDSLWLMVDVDRWGSKKLAEVTGEATTVGFGLALSNPCFETWLLFHLSEQLPNTSKCKEMEATLRQALGGSYNKTNIDKARFKPHVQTAAQRAEAADSFRDGRWPNDAGSHVYRVIRDLPPDVVTPQETRP